jgi:hypothetical protein
MAMNAGQVGGGNGGQTDMDRGQSYAFPYSKSQRKTGKVGSGSSTPNPVDKSGLSRPMTK